MLRVVLRVRWAMLMLGGADPDAGADRVLKGVLAGR